jgi:predicted  nucleic acid-binding Zn-ribbon protein
LPDIHQLYNLQAIDLVIDRNNNRLQVIATILGDDKSLRALRDMIEILKDKEGKASAHQEDLDLEHESIIQHIKKVETKLYGGTVSNPRELTDLGADLRQLSRQRTQQEEQLLDALGEVESLREELKTNRTIFGEQEIVWNRDQLAMENEIAEIDSDVAGLAVQRSIITDNLPPTELALYEQVRRGHSGKAIARVLRDACEGCRIGLPNRQLQEARSGLTFPRCPNCGLILLLE